MANVSASVPFDKKRFNYIKKTRGYTLPRLAEDLKSKYNDVPGKMWSRNNPPSFEAIQKYLRTSRISRESLDKICLLWNVAPEYITGEYNEKPDKNSWFYWWYMQNGGTDPDGYHIPPYDWQNKFKKQIEVNNALCTFLLNGTEARSLAVYADTPEANTVYYYTEEQTRDFFANQHELHKMIMRCVYEYAHKHKYFGAVPHLPHSSFSGVSEE